MKMLINIKASLEKKKFYIIEWKKKKSWIRK